MRREHPRHADCNFHFAGFALFQARWVQLCVPVWQPRFDIRNSELGVPQGFTALAGGTLLLPLDALLPDFAPGSCRRAFVEGCRLAEGPLS